MENLRFLIGMLAAFVFWGCMTECPDCGCGDCTDTDSGNLELLHDWSALWPGMVRPEEMDVYLYHPDLAFRHEVTYNDVSRYDVVPGHYEVLAVNRQDGALFRGMDNYYTAEVSLPARTSDSCIIVGEAPMLLFDRTAVGVGNRQSRCTVIPAPFVKTINFSIRVRRQGYAKEIKTCSGRLSGVLSSVKICIGQQAGLPASMDFDIRKENADVFRKSVALLGVNPEVSHKLKLWLTDGDGMVREAEVDVGGLDFSNTSVVDCNIEISLTGSGTDIRIADWERGCSGNIVLQ